MLNSLNEKLTKKEKLPDTHYFQDGLRYIDLVLTYDTSKDDPNIVEGRKLFIADLVSNGIQYEEEKSSIKENLIFIKLNAPIDVLHHFSAFYNMKLISKDKKKLKPLENNMINKIMSTPITPITGHLTYYSKYLSENNLSEYTSEERSNIVWSIISRAQFGNSKNQKGLFLAMEAGIFNSIYPLHDGSYEWPEEEDAKTTDRQLLAKFWANYKMYYKSQPLDLIDKYFGDEVGVYFTWLGFYNKMLMIAAIVGLICFTISLIYVTTESHSPSEEVCHSQELICPVCPNFRNCTYKPLNGTCFYSYLSHMCDNMTTVFFSAFMAFWATFFMEFWKRKEALLRWTWRLSVAELDTEIRPQFTAKVKHIKVSKVTNRSEPYLPKLQRVSRIAVTMSATVCLLMFVLLVLVSLILFRISLSKGFGSHYIDMSPIIISITTSSISVFIMISLQNVYNYIALKMTEFECPRTQTEFDKSFIHKKFVFSCVNFYTPCIYIAFFKGRFYTYPGDRTMWRSWLGKFKTDQCEPQGCFSELLVQLVITMLGKHMFMSAIEVVLPLLTFLYKKKGLKNYKDLPRWEQDYYLLTTDEYSINSEYQQLALQYGFVTLFVAVFPLAPIFALLVNLGQVRIDSTKLVKWYQRPVGRSVGGIGSWNGILQAITFLAVISNAFVIAFTSDFIPREVYRYQRGGDLEGYVNFSLSIYDTKQDFSHLNESSTMDRRAHLIPKYCYYRGFNNPPDHPQPYALSKNYWIILLCRLAFVLIFEHLVFLISGIIAYMVPDDPTYIKKRIAYETYQQRLQSRKQS